ncbi:MULTISPECIES: NifB/NifX family molybdenum-iron cluster-binding protein [unclassified Carboxylicivirga]|uniref:NifB/NifX family molybdenum-iron cluster-binding protein n=1 Tax=Carboxylicivirga TaxID=1628153 RepID=UPI003D341573
MKLAIPTKNNVVDDHFGHCEAYTIITADAEQNILDTEIMAAPAGCGCKSNIAAVLQQKGISVMLAGNMGTGALNALNSHGIRVFRGCSGDVMQVAQNYLNNKVEDSGIGCQQHGHGHQCEH